jgi:1-phosphofructokinase family hexose kinase
VILCVNLNPCVDKTLYLDRLVPEIIQTASRITTTVGGKANNVARVLSAFGYEAVAMNFFGGETGRLCERLLIEEDGVRTETVWTESPTREIITIHEEEPNRHTDIKEPSPQILSEERDELIERYGRLLDEAEFVSYGGSAPSKSVDDLPATLCRLARGRTVPFILDTYGEAFTLALDEQPFMVKPNVAEVEPLLGISIGDEAGEETALDALSAKAPLAVLSLGTRGFLAAYEGRRYRVHSPRVATVNSVGSGDALVAGIVMGLIEKKPFEETLALAAAAGAANAASPLACRMGPDDVSALIPDARVTAINEGA